MICVEGSISPSSKARSSSVETSSERARGRPRGGRALVVAAGLGRHHDLGLDACALLVPTDGFQRRARLLERLGVRDHDDLRPQKCLEGSPPRGSRSCPTIARARGRSARWPRRRAARAIVNVRAAARLLRRLVARLFHDEVIERTGREARSGGDASKLGSTHNSCELSMDLVESDARRRDDTSRVRSLVGGEFV